MTSAVNELRVALYNVLITSPEVAALVPAANIVDGAMKNLPGIRIAEMTEALDDRTYDRRYAFVSITLDVFVDDLGSSRANAIIGAITRALRGFAPAALDSCALWDLVYEASFVRRDLKNPDLAHGKIEFLAKIAYSEEARP